MYIYIYICIYIYIHLYIHKSSMVNLNKSVDRTDPLMKASSERMEAWTEQMKGLGYAGNNWQQRNGAPWQWETLGKP